MVLPVIDIVDQIRVSFPENVDVGAVFGDQINELQISRNCDFPEGLVGVHCCVQGQDFRRIVQFLDVRHERFCENVNTFSLKVNFVFLYGLLSLSGTTEMSKIFSSKEKDLCSKRLGILKILMSFCL
jgi:hypothetical protein